MPYFPYFRFLLLGCHMRFGYNRRMTTAPRMEEDPVIEAYKKHVDRTLIRKNLKLTVEERVIQLAKLQDFAEELRQSKARKRP